MPWEAALNGFLSGFGLVTLFWAISRVILVFRKMAE